MTGIVWCDRYLRIAFGACLVCRLCVPILLGGFWRVSWCLFARVTDDVTCVTDDVTCVTDDVTCVSHFGGSRSSHFSTRWKTTTNCRVIGETDSHTTLKGHSMRSYVILSALARHF